MKRKIIFSFLIVGLLLASCKSNKVTQQIVPDTLERMFWQIDGVDANGQKSTVYIQGTIHLGDERLYPLSPVVMNAWNSADRIVGEISTNDWAIFQTELQNKMIQSKIKMNGKDFLQKLSAKQKGALFSLLQEESANELGQYEPWITTTAISTAIYLKSGLSTEKGMDGRFMINAYQQGKEMQGLDTLETQFEVLEFGTYDEQLTMLKDTLDDIAEDKKITEHTKKLYEAYLSNNLQALTDIMQSDRMEAEKKNALYKKYYTLVFTERNKNWADKIEQYLKDGGTTFIFAGCEHFIGSDSVFEYLNQKGITVKAR